MHSSIQGFCANVFPYVYWYVKLDIREAGQFELGLGEENMNR